MKPMTRATIVSFVALLVFLAFVVVLRWTGFLAVTGTEANSHIIAAALALVGVLLSSVLTFGAVLLKSSIDERSEQRLSLEAAVQALQLFATSTGSRSLSIQRTGALFTLADLGQYSLVLSLMTELLEVGDLKASAAGPLLNRALRVKSEDTRRVAIRLLANYPARFLTHQDVLVPDTLFYGLADQARYVRQWAVIGLGRVLQKRSLKEWQQMRQEKRTSMVAALALAWDEEKDSALRSDCGAILSPVLKAFRDVERFADPRGGRPFDLGRVRKELELPQESTGAVAQEVAQLLQEWAK